MGEERLDRFRMLVGVVQRQPAEVHHDGRGGIESLSCSCASSVLTRLDQLVERGHGCRIRDARLRSAHGADSRRVTEPRTQCRGNERAYSFDAFVPSPFPSTSVTILRMRHILPHFCAAVRPAHLDPLDACRSAEAGVDAQVVLRVVAAAATHLAHERGAASDDADARADGAAIGLSCRPARAPSTTPPVGEVEPVQVRRVVHVVHHDVDVAVVVEVAERGASARARRRHRRAQTLGHVLESAVAQVAIDHLALLVARLGPRICSTSG